MQHDTEYRWNESVSRLTRDQRRAAATLGDDEARYLVDTYYQMQRERITAASRLRATEASGEPNSLLNWWFDQADRLEQQFNGALRHYAESNQIGRWALSQKGIGPVITAGLLANLELRPTVGAWWRFCGLDPSVTWKKGEKRPWNNSLKRLCWLIGESFVKVSGSDDAFYGRIYRERKALETERNAAGMFAEQAARHRARTIRRDDGTSAVDEPQRPANQLPQWRIHARAKRYAVKLFLSHLHHVWHEVETGRPPPAPYVIAHLGHVDYRAPPNWPLVE